jgi:integrase
MKVGELLDRYLADRVTHVINIKNLQQRSKPIRAFFGSKAITDICSELVAAYVAARSAGKVKWRAPNGKWTTSKGASTSTCRAELTLLIAARNWGWRAGLLPKDLRHIALPPDNPPRDRWLLRDEALAYLKAAQPDPNARLTRGYRVIAAGLYTGARHEAIAELTWDRIRLNLAAAQKLEALEKLGRGDEATGLNFGVIDYRVPGRVYTKKRRTAVPINPDMALVLLRAYMESKSPYYLDRPKKATYELRGIAKAAGLHDIANCHVLRHTFATWAAQDGLPLVDIAAALADTIATVEKRYAHHHPDYLRRVQARRILGSNEQYSAINGLDWQK